MRLINDLALAESRARMGVSGADTIADLLARRAARTPEAAAFHTWIEGRRWEPITWSALVQRAASLAAALRACGLEPGDRVAIVAPRLLNGSSRNLGRSRLAGAWQASNP